MLATAHPAFDYAGFGARLALDLVSLLVLVLALGLHRGARRDLLTVLACFNLGLLVVLTVMASAASATAIGFGLFAMLSIIRLRSEPFDNTQLGVFFTGLVLALVNGVGGLEVPVTVLLDTIVLVTVFIADHPALGPMPKTREVTLDRVHDDDAAVRADVEHRLGLRVIEFTIIEVDF